MTDMLLDTEAAIVRALGELIAGSPHAVSLVVGAAAALAAAVAAGFAVDALRGAWRSGSSDAAAR
jgi:hypothetical protein